VDKKQSDVGLQLPKADNGQPATRLQSSGFSKSEIFCRNPESPEIGKGGWPGTAELAAVQPMVHVDLNVT